MLQGISKLHYIAVGGSGQTKKKRGNQVTVKQVYAMLVIDCKIDPAYVLKDINDWEVEALLERSSDRYKESWEKARFIAFFSAYAQRLKKLIAVHTLYAFPWEEENVEKPKAPSRERMREMAREAQEEYDKYKRGELKPAKF